MILEKKKGGGYWFLSLVRGGSSVYIMVPGKIGEKSLLPAKKGRKALTLPEWGKNGFDRLTRRKKGPGLSGHSRGEGRQIILYASKKKRNGGFHRRGPVLPFVGRGKRTTRFPGQMDVRGAHEGEKGERKELYPGEILAAGQEEPFK